jgi:hypothetical protein
MNTEFLFLVSGVFLGLAIGLFVGAFITLAKLEEDGLIKLSANKEENK